MSIIDAPLNGQQQEPGSVGQQAEWLKQPPDAGGQRIEEPGPEEKSR